MYSNILSGVTNLFISCLVTTILKATEVGNKIINRSIGIINLYLQFGPFSCYKQTSNKTMAQLFQTIFTISGTRNNLKMIKPAIITEVDERVIDRNLVQQFYLY